MALRDGRRNAVAAAVAAGGALCLGALIVALPEHRTWATPNIVGGQARLPTLSASGALPASPALQGIPAQQAAAGSAAWGRASSCAMVLGALAFAQLVARAASSRVARQGSLYEERLGYRISGPPGRPGSPRPWAEKIRWVKRFKKRISIRKKVWGSAARPRLAVFRSQHHMHVNVVDDTVGTGVTMITCASTQKDIQEAILKESGATEGMSPKTWTSQAAEVVGKDVAQKCLEKNITKVVFDRGGFPYQGRVKALAEAARSAGLQF